MCSTRNVLIVGAAVVVTVGAVVVIVMVASRSGSAGSSVSTVLFRGASGLLHGVGEPLRLPVAAPSPASDELEDAEPSNSVYSCKEKCKFLKTYLNNVPQCYKKQNILKNYNETFFRLKLSKDIDGEGRRRRKKMEKGSVKTCYLNKEHATNCVTKMRFQKLHYFCAKRFYLLSGLYCTSIVIELPH